MAWKKLQVRILLAPLMQLRKIRSACVICPKIVENIRSKYCSNTCQAEAQYQEYIKKWKDGSESGNKNTGRNLSVSSHIKRYLIEKYGNKCSISDCGWNKVNPVTGKVPIQTDHIDGNPFNSKEENLRLLCPNCHSLTPTYGALNKGKGRQIKAVFV